MAVPSHSSNQESWPDLPLDAWQETYATLHMWTQIVGKVRLALSPRINHWWEVPLYVNARGLTTSAIPYGEGAFEVQFDSGAEAAIGRRLLCGIYGCTAVAGY